MRKRRTKVIFAAGGFVAAGAGGSGLGLRVKPEPFPQHPERTRNLETAELPSDLPEPVSRHFRATLGSSFPGSRPLSFGAGQTSR